MLNRYFIIIIIAIKDMLLKSNYIFIHVKNIQGLVVKFCKKIQRISAPIMKYTVTKISPIYDLCSCRAGFLRSRRNKLYGIDTIAFEAVQKWSRLAVWCTILSQLDLLRSQRKNQHYQDCFCNIYEFFVYVIGFIKQNIGATARSIT